MEIMGVDRPDRHIFKKLTPPKKKKKEPYSFAPPCFCWGGWPFFPPNHKPFNGVISPVILLNLSPSTPQRKQKKGGIRVEKTLPETENRPKPNRKGSSSNHPFLGAFAVSFREGKSSFQASSANWTKKNNLFMRHKTNLELFYG